MNKNDVIIILISIFTYIIFIILFDMILPECDTVECIYREHSPLYPLTLIPPTLIILVYISIKGNEIVEQQEKE